MLVAIASSGAPLVRHARTCSTRKMVRTVGVPYALALSESNAASVHGQQRTWEPSRIRAPLFLCVCLQLDHQEDKLVQTRRCLQQLTTICLPCLQYQWRERYSGPCGYCLMLQRYRPIHRDMTAISVAIAGRRRGVEKQGARLYPVSRRIKSKGPLPNKHGHCITYKLLAFYFPNLASCFFWRQLTRCVLWRGFKRGLQQDEA
jgi:hypothetical protein